MRLFLAVILITFISTSGASAQDMVKIAFYNLENLYDTINDPAVDDGDYTPEGRLRWNTVKYNQKLTNLAKVINALNADILGVCEAENERVLRDLVNSETLISKNYGIIHHDSRDRRGIDVAILYKKDIIAPVDWEPIDIGTSRNAMNASLAVAGDTISVYVVHMPSRISSSGDSLRMKAAGVLRSETLKSKHKVILMGDFNDNPDDSSMRLFGHLYNSMNIPYERGAGSTAYRDRWSMFDQILADRRFIKSTGLYLTSDQGHIFVRDFMVVGKGNLRSYPKRGRQKGYSDHLPVFIFLGKNE